MPNKYSTLTADEVSTKVVGMEYNDAFELATNNKVLIRIRSHNGALRVLTRDYNPNRINVDVSGTKITAVKIG